MGFHYDMRTAFLRKGGRYQNEMHGRIRMERIRMERIRKGCEWNGMKSKDPTAFIDVVGIVVWLLIFRRLMSHGGARRLPIV